MKLSPGALNSLDVLGVAEAWQKERKIEEEMWEEGKVIW